MVYLMLAVPLHLVFLLVILGVVILVTKIISPNLTGRAVRWSIGGVSAMFLGGLVGHLYWSEFVWNVIYYSPDYMVDFWMLFPASERLMHPAGWPAGHLVGEHTASDIRLAWLNVASVCWISTILIILMPQIIKLTISRATATPISLPVYMLYRNSNLNPVIDARPR